MEQQHAQNWICGIIAWVVLTFSLAPLVTTFWPVITLKQSFIAALPSARSWEWSPRYCCCGRRDLARMSRSSTAPAATGARPTWTAPRGGRPSGSAEPRGARPRIDTLQRPALSMARRIGLLSLRGYILFAIVIMVIKLVQVTTAHH